MARYYMKYLSLHNKIALFCLYIYIAPLIASDIFVLKNDYLLGDFSSVEVNIGFVDIIWLNLIYVFPLGIIFLLIKNKTKNNIYLNIDNYYIRFYILLISINFFISIMFGSLTVGGSNPGGIIGIIISLNNKLIPYLLLIMLSGLNAKYHEFIFSCIMVLIITYLQKSILGYFVIFISSYLLIIIKNKFNIKRILLLFILPFLAAFLMKDFLLFIYDLRNSSRGSYQGIDPDLIFSYALGRINSLSSLYSIYYGGCCNHEVSNYYALGTFIQRLIPLSLGETINPTHLFNSYILGDLNSNYAIFTSTAGALLILLQSSFFVACINILFILLIIKFSYYIMPFPDNNYKSLIFILGLYFVYLSGDIWEFSILFQSFIFVKILQLIYFNFRFRFAKS